MKKFKLKGLLQQNGWIQNPIVSVDSNGIITSIKEDGDEEAENINGFGLPGFQNAHSHGFQYAMAGLAEIHATGSVPDDFWGWREAMYQLALSVSPDEMEAIASMLYSEMARHGYTDVAEFHYVHHDKDGTPYSNLSEMGERMINAAKNAGIGITLIPIYYQMGGFNTPPNERQRRFISATDQQYLNLLSACENSSKYYTHANVGIGIHSMRGVKDDSIINIARLKGDKTPFHIHIAEQLKEIEDCEAFLGKRPVEWLLDNVDLNENYHLVHATHLTDSETIGIAKSKAKVVICPTTEGNLGDGIFPLRLFQENVGQWSIGTDSHIGINPLEELRLLDYGQRLVSHKRNTFTDICEGDSGAFGIRQATVNGRIAMGNHNPQYFEVGEYFDCAIIDAEAPLIRNSGIDKLTSTIVYSCDATHQLGTISKGNWVVKEGKHVKREEINRNFDNVMQGLKSRS